MPHSPQLVAQVPSVASGVTTTSWQVDVDLPDHAPYWWRARASDGVNTGPWCEAGRFQHQRVQQPPLPVMIASPANDSLLIDGNGLLVWFQTLDPDLGDQVLDYQIQIDNDHLFGSPEVDSSGITVDGLHLRTGIPRLRPAQQTCRAPRPCRPGAGSGASAPATPVSPAARGRRATPISACRRSISAICARSIRTRTGSSTTSPIPAPIRMATAWAC